MRFEALDSFRGLFAIAVVVHHLNIQQSITELEIFKNSGYFVEFFFVLSGFVIAHSTTNRRKGYLSFVVARSKRLLPLYYFTLAIMCSIEVVKYIANLNGFEFNNPPFEASTSPQNMAINLALVQSWTELTPHPSINPPAWSVSVEYFLYLFLFPVLALQAGRARACIALLILTVIVNWLGVGLIRSSLERGIICFLFGVLTYELYLLTLRKPTWKATNSTVLQTTVLGVALYLMIQNIEPAMKVLLLALSFSAVILVYADSEGSVIELLVKPIFRHLGKISYAIYLMHYPVIFAVYFLLMIVDRLTGLNLIDTVDGSRYLVPPGKFEGNLILAGIILLVIIVSHLAHTHVERRFYNFGK